jgi:RimJ/RimL family protein N-acetyltransferase
MGCARLQWVVLDWNERSINFYKSCGARDLAEWKLMRFEADDMASYLGRK